MFKFRPSIHYQNEFKVVNRWEPVLVHERLRRRGGGRVYLFNGRRSDLADAISMVVDVPLVVATESVRPQVRSAEVGVRIIDATHVRPLADQSERHVQRQPAELVGHFAPEGLHVDAGRRVRLRISVEDVARAVLHGVEVSHVAWLPRRAVVVVVVVAVVPRGRRLDVVVQAG